ncbi:unnamed protein product [Fusarium graminearum]|uniref:Chromosome 3, complete genome n=1 Tax=Gibberella zeae (strain ATCC MYA-4620 / CBS 123657 / FGSC 9075 / NRRL 31084 / PH-1) TaxID=229533 RepID=A0A098DXK7_GIBZE|nr:unnamed protein product [Fusarium graminearum]CZS83944.1 unnamed protein product [Fusarium graminearum]
MEDLLNFARLVGQACRNADLNSMRGYIGLCARYLAKAVHMERFKGEDIGKDGQRQNKS